MTRRSRCRRSSGSKRWVTPDRVLALNGRYHFVHLLANVNPPGVTTNVYNLSGTIGFDGAGRFTFSGDLGSGETAPTPLSGSGVYSVAPTGVVLLDQQTLPMELAAMRDYARKRGWQIAVEVKDVGSGAAVRQKREELLGAARRREIDLVVVWRLDRWGRSLVDLVNTLQELSSLKVGFVSLSEALDLTTPSGRALAGMLAVFAEFERDILRDRVKAGIAQARKEAKPLGRPPTAALAGRHD